MCDYNTNMTTRQATVDIEDTENGISDTNHADQPGVPSADQPVVPLEDEKIGLNDLEIKPTVADSLKSPKMIRAFPFPTTGSGNQNGKTKKNNTGFDPEIPERQSRKQFKTMTSIEQAKDRAQVTAATSMSIVHVALLKDLLDEGPSGNPYYSWTFGFILTALILQIFAGFISLYIALLRYYFTEYQDDFLDDCIKTCCPCRCKRRKHADHVDSIRAWVEESQNDKTGSTLVIDRCKKEQKCCPIYCTTSRYAEYEHQVLELYELMVEENIKSDLLAANYDLEIKWLDERGEELKTELEKCQAANDGDAAEMEEDVKIIKAELKRVKKQRHQIKERNKNAQEYSIQGPVLEKHVEQIQEERVLKRSTFWQNWLNMMMYTVFVLNALIAGFGLAHPSTDGSVPVNTTAG